jgi:hypothetical protein
MTERYQTTLGFNDHQVAELAKRAITPQQARDAGVIPVQDDVELAAAEIRQEHGLVAPAYWTEANGYLPGMLFPLISPTPGVPTQYQIKPDVPHVNEDGTTSKYLFPKGFQPVLHVARHVPGAMRALLVEGTHQVIAAAIYAPPECSVYGISGCWSWQSGGEPTEDLMDLAGIGDAVIVLDADAASNLQVYEAGAALATELAIYGVESVKFAQVPGRGKDGLDDVLAKRPEAVRHRLMELMIKDAIAKPAPAKPTAAAEAKRAAKVAREQQEQAEAHHDAETGLVRFDISRPKAQVIGELVEVLASRLGGDALFNRGNVLTMREGDVLKVVTKDVLLDAVSQLLRPGRPNAATAVWEESWPDLGVQGVVLQRYDSFPELEQVVHSPFVRADGTVCLVNGYDADSRTFVLMAEGMAERLNVPEEPTSEDVAAAVKLLLGDWLVDFPFPTDADRANALAWIITPFIRGQVDVVPIAVVDGNGPSAGKGLLAELFARLVLGEPLIPSTLPTENDEVRKAITSAMISGSSVLIWDEAHVLEGTALAQLLTAPVWRDRKLGVSEMATIANRVTFASLGNNVTVNGDIGRRAYRIRIFPQQERPEDRDVDLFRHPDIKGWTDDNRAELLSAVLVLIRAWHVAGRPAGPSNFGSFEKWSRMVGGILANAGVTGFLAGRREWLEHSNETVNTWAMHLEWLSTTFKGRAFRCQEVAEKLARAGTEAPLPGIARTLASPENTASYVQSLGQAYRHRVDQTHNGLTLERAGKTNGYAHWRVLRQSMDKTDIGVFTPPENETDKTTSSELEGGSRETTGATSTPTRSETTSLDQDQLGVDVARVGTAVGMVPHIPLLPPQSSGVTGGVTEADPDQYLTGHAHPYTSLCENGHTEVLVDGLWYACSICFPSTTRIAPIESETP